MKKIAMLVMMFVMMVSMAHGAAMIFECDVVGAKLQIYDDNIRDWGSPISFPYTVVKPQSTLVTIKVTASGYEDFEQLYETSTTSQRHVINLVSAYNTKGATFFGCAGQIISKRGLSIMASQYKVVFRNMTTHKKNNAAQVSQDIVYNSANGYFEGCLVNFSTARSQDGSAALPGDKVFVGVFNSRLTMCYGYVYVTITEDNISESAVYNLKIFIR